MNSNIDQEFVNACRRKEFSRLAPLVRQGANVARGEDGGKVNGLHLLIPEIARSWPDHRDSLELFLRKGVDLNFHAKDGTPLHVLGSYSGVHSTQEREDNVQAFLREAVDSYGGDLQALRYFKDAPRPVMVEYMATSKGFSPILQTLFALGHEQEAYQSSATRRDLAKSWLNSHYRNNRPLTNRAWWSAGLDIGALEQWELQHVNATRIQQQCERWEQENPALSSDAPDLKQRLFSANPVDAQGDSPPGMASPLYNPDNWKRMDALFDACEQAGAPVTKDDVLQPVADGKNFLQIAAEVTCRPKLALELCAQRGIQLTREDLLAPDGQPGPTLESFIATKAVPLLFSEANWQGQPKSDLQAVFNALPELDRSMVHNLHQLRAGLEESRLQVGR